MSSKTYFYSFFNLIIFFSIYQFSLLGCKKEKEDQPPKTPILKQTNKTGLTPLPKTKKPPLFVKKIDKTKIRSKRLVEQLNLLNQCIYKNVSSLKKLLENDQPETPKKYSHLKKLTTKCEKNLLDIFTNNPDLSNPYKKYFILAGSAIDNLAYSVETLSIPENTPKKVSKAHILKTLELQYNKFALMNNDLHGVNILLKKDVLPSSTLDIQTYGDELARLGTKVWDITYLWHKNHSFLNHQRKVRPSWMNSLRRELIILFFVNIEIEKKISYFNSFKCIKGFARKTTSEKKSPSLTPPIVMAKKKNKIEIEKPAKSMNKEELVKKPQQPVDPKKKKQQPECKDYMAKSKMLIKSAKNYLKIWEIELKNLQSSYPVISPSLSSKTKASYELLKSAVSVLPEKLK
jgi:hypothetical protein